MEKIICIVGPTAVGKTKMSIALARYFNGEIVNADSTQVYRDLDIATAKVTEAEKEGVPHHLFDICSLDQEYTVYDYQKDARKKIEEIQKRGHLPIFVGGTGLYLKAVFYNYQFLEEEKSLDFQNLTTEELYQKVKEVDPNSQIHEHNRKRLERSYAYYLNHHLPFSAKEKNEKPLYEPFFIGLTMEREFLYERINDRVDQMVEQGLLDEAKKIYETNLRTKAVMTPIGYKELFPYFEGQISLSEALDKIRQNSRHYAKRQYTWWRHQLPVTWFEIDPCHFDQTIAEVISFINSSK